MGPTPKGWCPFKREKFGHRYTEQTPCKDDGKAEVKLLQVKECRLPISHQKLEEVHGTEPSLSLQKQSTILDL